MHSQVPGLSVLEFAFFFVVTGSFIDQARTERRVIRRVTARRVATVATAA